MADFEADEMRGTASQENVVIKHHKAAEPLLLLILTLVDTTLLIFEFHGHDTHPGLWGFVSAGLTLLCLWSAFRLPLETIFNSQEKTIERFYRWPPLAPEHQISRFSDWAFVRTYIEIQDENCPVCLELRSHSRKTMLLTSRGVHMDPKAKWTSWWDQYCEPEELKTLREQIARLTGVTDLGFQRPN